MVDFYTQRISKHYYYSNFFPERHFDTDEDAIEFEKKISFSGITNVLSFWERDQNSIPAPWNVDANNNYQTPISHGGFKEIPYYYKVKKCLIKIEQDEIDYYYLNEDTMEYELLEKVSNEENDYIHQIFYSDILQQNKLEDEYSFGENRKYGFIIKDRFGLLENPGKSDTLYYTIEENSFWKWIKKENSDEYGYDKIEVGSIKEENFSSHICKIDNTKNELSLKRNSTGAWQTYPYVIAETRANMPAASKDTFYYFKSENIMLFYTNGDFSDVNMDNYLFFRESTNTEGYLDQYTEVTADKWYVRVCRNIYSTFMWIWRGLVSIGKAIGEFFSNLWSWVKGESYFGSEIKFYWGNNIALVDSADTLKATTGLIEEDKYFQSLQDLKCYWKYEDSKWIKYNLAKWENFFRKTGHPEQVVSRLKDLKNKTIKVGDYTLIYVTQTEKIYKVWKENKDEENKWSAINTVSDEAFNLLNSGVSLIDIIYYCEKEAQCYQWRNGTWREDKQHSSFDGLYEAADAIRQVLNYKGEIYSTVFKKFNGTIKILNEELGYSFPTLTNTVQPQKESDNGDWGFYYYDKVKGWITGREAHDLGIL